MKAIKITYWITTVIIALMMCWSAYGYLTSAQMMEAFHHLGYPDHFRIELAIAKFIGAVLLLAPVPPRLKEWAYAGFAFTFFAAVVAHSAAGDAMAHRITPAVFLVLLMVSYVTYHKSRK